MEIWTGRRAGVEGARAVYGATEAFSTADLDARLAALLDGAGTLWFRLGQDAAWDGRVGRALQSLRGRERRGALAPPRLVDAGLLLHEARLHKAPEELAALRKAAALTAEGHLAAMRLGRPGRREHELQAAIEYAFRRTGGGGPGYGTIVAAGANATVLHYRAGDTELRDGELCLVDAGGEWGWYTADVTRTFPVSGRFSDAQRAAYEVVLEAELAGIAATRPGATVDGIHDLVVRVLVEGMIRLGLLQGSADERIADKSYERYYMHRTSHWLGLDVHDVGPLPAGRPAQAARAGDGAHHGARPLRARRRRHRPRAPARPRHPHRGRPRRHPRRLREPHRRRPQDSGRGRGRLRRVSTLPPQSSATSKPVVGRIRVRGAERQAEPVTGDRSAGAPARRAST